MHVQSNYCEIGNEFFKYYLHEFEACEITTGCLEQQVYKPS
jgi:hypothetical protein